MTDLRVRPAHEVSFGDIQAVFGERGDAADCQCQWFKRIGTGWRHDSREARAEELRAQTNCDKPGADETTGLVAYLGDEPVGWVAVEPRVGYPRLRTQRIPWAGRDEDPDDLDVWAVTCFVTRVGFRRQGVGTALARAAVEWARGRGARAVEGYPVLVEPGRKLSAADIFTGTSTVFEAAGFREVSRPTPRRVVMRVDV